MAQIFETLIKFFQEDEWKISQLENKKILQMGFSGNNGNWTCYAQAIDKDGQFIFYSVCPVKVPPEKQISVAELITRANYGLLIGNFELDFNDGEIRYKTSIDIQDQNLTSSLIRQLVFANVVMMDRYLPSIMAVIYGNFSPQQAIEQIENNVETASKES